MLHRQPTTLFSLNDPEQSFWDPRGVPTSHSCSPTTKRPELAKKCPKSSPKYIARSAPSGDPTAVTLVTNHSIFINSFVVKSVYIRTIFSQYATITWVAQWCTSWNGQPWPCVRAPGTRPAPFFSALESGRPDSWKIRTTLFRALVFQIRVILKIRSTLKDN